ncbi:lipoprotein insertase outer membrane protein LolB [Wenzhouxiangella sp. EGI_FJ10409]|uniref:lipoprotein insertase outer membrane protein LolB n=1 Tax=Wenzhouxiangella sp. EGI_FJ10409 TaxID=3243767 RepID=UPI0035E34E63
MRPAPAALARVAILLAAGLLLVACAGREQRPAGAWLDEREAWFDDHPNWNISGRLGLHDGERGGSLGFTWRAEGEEHRIHLRTSAGGQQWRLRFSPGRAVLEGSEVGRLTGDDPDPLVEEAIGWPIPVHALSWWIRGLLPPGGGDLRFADDGTLAGVNGPVWTLDYQHFKSYEGRLLPTRMEGRSGDYRVRFLIADWRFGVEAR